MIKPEFPDEVVFITSRTIMSRLWFKLDPKLCNFFEAALARYQEIYQVEIFAFCLLGNHYHLLARFPKANRALFERDFNSIIARALPRLVSGFEGGKLWARPYRFQLVPNDEDIQHWFLYTLLNPVSSGISTDPTDLGRPNALSIIREGGSRVCRWFNHTAYKNAKRKNPTVDKERYYTNHTLRIMRLPEMAELSDAQYLKSIEDIVGEKRHEIIRKRISDGFGFLDKKKITSQKAGIKPLHTKTSTRESHNPLVLCLCIKTRKKLIQIYLEIADRYKIASYKFRNRIKNFTFPPNTYMPPCHMP